MEHLLTPGDFNRILGGKLTTWAYGRTTQRPGSVFPRVGVNVRYRGLGIEARIHDRFGEARRGMAS